jgi:hypothetical protein
MVRDSMPEVELDVFSGRPNPRWTLPAELADTLRTELAERLPAEPQTAPGLGYRGFVITNLGQVGGIPQRLRAYRAVLTVGDRDGTTHYRDTHGVEEALLEDARRQGYGDLIGQLGGPSSRAGTA